MAELWQLFWVFCRVGALTFGGGYAMLPIVQKEIVEDRRWASQEQIIDYYALSQSVPGIIAVNMAVFLGYERKRVPGAIAAALGVVFPSLVIITVIASFIPYIQEVPFLQHAFAGVRVAVIALIVHAAWAMWRASVRNRAAVAFFAGAFLIMAAMPVSPIVIILVAAVVGAFLRSWGRRP